MQFSDGEYYHLYNRGNNRQTVFFTEEHYRFFLSKFRKMISPRCEVLAWCLMPNHFHFIIQATAGSVVNRPAFGGKPMQELTYFTGQLLSSYTQAINKEMGRTGSLWEPKTTAKAVDELRITNRFQGSLLSYLETLIHYVHQNPLKADLAKTLAQWAYTSYPDLAGLRNGSLCNKELLFRIMDWTEAEFVHRSHNLWSSKSQ